MGRLRIYAKDFAPSTRGILGVLVIFYEMIDNSAGFLYN